MVIDDIIQLTYHLEVHDTIASKVVFCRVIGREKREDEIFLSRENSVTYQVWRSQDTKGRWNISERTTSMTCFMLPLYSTCTAPGWHHQLSGRCAAMLGVTGSTGRNVAWRACSSHAWGHVPRFGHQADPTFSGILQNAGSAAVGLSSAGSWQGSWNFLCYSLFKKRENRAAKADTVCSGSVSAMDFLSPIIP